AVDVEGMANVWLAGGSHCDRAFPCADAAFRRVKFSEGEKRRTGRSVERARTRGGLDGRRLERLPAMSRAAHKGHRSAARTIDGGKEKMLALSSEDVLLPYSRWRVRAISEPGAASGLEQGGRASRISTMRRIGCGRCFRRGIPCTWCCGWGPGYRGCV